MSEATKKCQFRRVGHGRFALLWLTLSLVVFANLLAFSVLAKDAVQGFPFPEFPVIDKPVKQYTLATWNSRDGLPHNSVNRITQTKDGYLWLATWEGPVRFNGREFQVFDDLAELQMEETGVIDIQRDASGYGVLAAGPRGGITHYRSGRWQALSSAPDFVNETATTSSGEVWAAASGAGVIRYLTDGTVRQYTVEDGLPDRFAFRVHVLHGNSADNYQVDPDYFDDIWIGTQRGVSRYLPETDTFIRINHLPSEIYRDVIRLQSGHIAAASASGIYFCTPDVEQCARYPEQLEGVVTSLHQGMQGELWFGTFAHGLGRISANGVDYFTVEHGLPNQHVLDVFQDSEANIWVSTHGGLAQLRDALFTSFTRIQGVQGNFIRAVQQAHDGSIWIGSNEGLTRVEGNTLHPVIPPEFESISALSIAPYTDSAVLIGSYTDGLVLLENEQVLAQFGRAQGLSLPEVRAVVYDPEQELVWAGSPEGLFALRLVDNEFRVVQKFNATNGLTADFVSALQLDSHGQLWVGSITGLTRLRETASGQWAAESIELSQFTVAQNLFAIDEYDGRVWFASDRGVLVHELETETWQWIARADGLPFDKYFSVTFSEDESLWLGSSRGIVRIAAEQWRGFLTGRLHSLSYTLFGSTDGMVSNQINSGGPSSLLDQAGNLWFASAEGAVRLDPRLLADHGIMPPPVVIDGVIVDGIPISTAAEMPGRFTRIGFRYSGLGYRMTRQLQYRVQLRGFDADWIRRDQQTYSEYTALPSGEYEFIVQTRYPGSEWSDSVSYSFTVAARFYEYPMFWSAVVIGFIGFFYLLMHARLKSLERSKNELKRLVREQTKELQMLAHEDTLTHMPNRRAFDLHLKSALMKARKLDQPLCLAILDLDHFKQINDAYLHAAGDRVLIRVAKIIQENIREQDYAARWGGEEFAIVFTNTTEKEALAICERIRVAIERADYADIARGIKPTLSAGLACRQGQEDHSTLLVHADKALYQAKENGRNQVCIYRRG